MRAATILLGTICVPILIVLGGCNRETSEAEGPAGQEAAAAAASRKAAEAPEADESDESAVLIVAQHLAGNKLGIAAEDLRSLPNPKGEGTFVYCPDTRFHGVERKVIWLVVEGQAYPLNGATKGTVTPSLLWPREAPEEQWRTTGLDPYSPAEALTIVFGG